VGAGLKQSLEFPGTGNFTGNFAEIGSFGNFLGEIHLQYQNVSAKFPTQKNREFLPA
jgi:hypothetical protein